MGYDTAATGFLGVSLHDELIIDLA